MPIFSWEKQIIDIARSWPREGPLFEFFNFWTLFSESGWLLLLFMVTLSLEIGWKKLVTPTILVLASVGADDLLSRRIVKALVMRPRPNYLNADCQLSSCWGFVSSHATNITGAAVVLCLYDRRNVIWTLPCVLLVSFSRIYVIDHYPLDVFGGMVLGAFVGTIIWLIFSKILKKQALDSANSTT